MHAVDLASEDASYRGKIVGRKVEKVVELVKNVDSNNHGNDS